MQEPSTNTLQSLPPLPGETEILSNNKKSLENAKNNNSKVAFAFISIVFIAVSVGAFLLYKSANDHLGLTQFATPAEVIDALNVSVISDDQKRLLPVAGVVPKQDIEVSNMSELETIDTLPNEFDQLTNQVAVLVNAIDKINGLSEQLNQINQRIDGLEHEINNQSQESKAAETELNDLKKIVQDFEQKLSQETRATKPTEQARTAQPSPPKTLSSAMWQGREAVLVNDRSTIRLLYVGDTVANWQIVDLSHHSIVWRSLLTNERITAVIGG